MSEAEQNFELVGAPGISLHASGLRHPRSGWLGGPGVREAFTPYADLTHVVAGARGVRIGTLRESLTLPRRRFRHPDDAPRLVVALRDRVASGPGGAARLAQMEALDRRLRDTGNTRLARGLLLACLVGFALQWASPAFEGAAIFSTDLVRVGELWRLVTANFLHGGLSHLTLNGLGLWVLGTLLERVVGWRAAAFVVALSALLAMGGAYLAGYALALGASGIVAGLAGALLWLEIRRPDCVPAPFRLPRRLMVAAIAADLVGLAFVPGIAHWAHVGGLLGGAVGVALVAPTAGRRVSFHRAWLPLANAILGAAAMAAVLLAGWVAWSPDAGAAQLRARRLLELPDVHPLVLNNEAWTIAMGEDPDPELLAVAQALAERAVARTVRRDPNLLDTLAEVYFQQGETERALAVIDEAIELAPGVTYFAEQRRRFSGDRPADDRPDPPEPLLPGTPGPPGREPPQPGGSPGIRI